MKYFAPPSPRSIMSVSGNDAHAFLQSMITNDMDLLQSQNSIYAALLTPQGKVISTFFVVTNPDGGFFLDCPTGAFETLLKRLTMFRLRADVQLNDLSDKLQLLVSDQKSDVLCFADPRNQAMGFRCLVPVNTKKLPHDKENLRLKLILPEQDIDYQSSEVFPSDINMDLQNGIAWKKGCYVGQEVVSRMKRRGNIKKRTVLAKFTEHAPKAGCEIIAGKAKLGHLLSSFEHLALAMIRTDRVAKIEAGEITADGQPISLTAPMENTK
ncbi:MAG: folate-binding protein YgfZ [Robiginitomaculum sp.]|nr:folate-binding protein YgfZ [Robiginitomaculum sp.]